MQATVPLSRLNITLYSVERRAQSIMQKNALISRALNRFLSNQFLQFATELRLGAAFLFPLPPLLESRGDSPGPLRFTARHEESVWHLHWAGVCFRARSVRSIDLEPCLKFTEGNVNEVGTTPDCSIRMQSIRLFLHAATHNFDLQFDVVLGNIAKSFYREIVLSLREESEWI